MGIASRELQQLQQLQQLADSSYNNFFVETAKLPPERCKTLICLQSNGWQFWWQQVKKV